MRKIGGPRAKPPENFFTPDKKYPSPDNAPIKKNVEWKLNIHTLQIKSFLPHTLVFYPLFLRLQIVQNLIFRFGLLESQIQVGDKKLVDGGKKLLICKEMIFIFHLHKKMSLKSFKIAEIS